MMAEDWVEAYGRFFRDPPTAGDGAEMKAHPYADILPLLEGEAFDSLVADIRANGLLEPITIHEGMILDGRNRYRACKAAGIEPQFLEFDGDDPLAFVLSLNLHRRHLDESQRAMVAARLANLKHGDERAAIANLQLPRKAASPRLLNVSRSGVQRARAVVDKGCARTHPGRRPRRHRRVGGGRAGDRVRSDSETGRRRARARPCPREAGGPSRARIRTGDETARSVSE